METMCKSFRQVVAKYLISFEEEVDTCKKARNMDINQNEIELHDISLIDHTYENKFGYDLNKSRSFSLGFNILKKN